MNRNQIFHCQTVHMWDMGAHTVNPTALGKMEDIIMITQSFFLKSREMRLRDQKNQIFGSLSIRSVLTENGNNLTLRYEVKRGRT